MSYLLGLLSITCILGIQPAAIATAGLTASNSNLSNGLMANTSTDVSLAEQLYQTFTEIAEQPCDGRQSMRERGIVYQVCTANAGGRGQYRFISASASLVEAEDGIGYWYYLNGKVAAIRFFHTGELFMFDTQGKLQGELIPPQKVISNGVEVVQQRSLRNVFTTKERERLEKLAQGGGEEILSRFREPRRNTRKVLAQQSQCQATIRRITNRLEAIPKVRVTNNSGFAELISAYPDPSAGLTRRYIFALKGEGLDQLWQAPDLLIRLTRQVIDNCEGTAVVTFGKDHSGDFVNVGLFPNGEIKRFSCAADLEDRTNNRTPMAWGQQACDL